MGLFQKNAVQKVLVFILVAALGILPLSACDKEQPVQDQTASEDSSTPAANSPEEDKEGKTISTPVGDLECPANWGDDVQIADNVSSDEGSIDFYGSVNNKQVKLFSLWFGSGTQGHVLGTAPDSSGAPVTISLDISEVEKEGDWTDDDASRMNDLQEGVNDLLDQIYRLNGFESSSNQ
jgi:hypothetical protein